MDQQYGYSFILLIWLNENLVVCKARQIHEQIGLIIWYHTDKLLTSPMEESCKELAVLSMKLQLERFKTRENKPYGFMQSKII